MNKIFTISMLCLALFSSCNKIDKHSQSISDEPRNITVTIEKDIDSYWGIYITEYDEVLYNELSSLANEYHENLLKGVRDDEITKPFWDEFNNRDWLYSGGFNFKKTFDMTIPNNELLIIVYGHAFYSSYSKFGQPYYYVIHKTVTEDALYIHLKLNRFD